MKIRLVLATLMTVALFSTIVYAAGDDDGQIIDNPWAHLFTTAPTTQETTTQETTTETPTETTPADGYYEVSNYKSSGDPYTYRYPSQTGKVFAGWFIDSTCKTPYTEESGRAYAKFVDENLLTTKFQMGNDGTAFRFLSSIDSLDYESIGFLFNGKYGEYEVPITTKTVETVYRKITAAGESVEPKVFSPEAQFFSIYTVRSLNPSYSLEWNVTPFWVTLDGTKVLGKSKHYPIS